MSSERQKETIFLRRCIRYEESAASRQLEERIAHAQRNEFCLHRARWSVAFLTALAVACLGYEAVFQGSFPLRMPVFNSQLVTTVVCTLGLGSLISLLAFTVLGVVFHHELNKRREEGRRFIAGLLEVRLGHTRLSHQNGVIREPGAIVPPDLLVAPIPAIGKPSRTALEPGGALDC
jgi:hypothetical protein